MRSMTLRYLTGIAALPVFLATAWAQPAPQPAQPAVEPPAPPPTVERAPAPPTATPAPAPSRAPRLVEPAAPPPSLPAAADEPLEPAATLSQAAPEVTTTSMPRPAGSDALPTTSGPAGLLRLSTAEVGAPLQLRVGVTGEYFQSDSFIIQGDRNLRLAGGLALGFTPVRYLELFASISGTANRNRRDTNEVGRSDPEVIKSYGDLTLGTKFAYPLGGGVSAGGELGVHFLSSVAGISFAPSATSVWLNGLSSWDLRKAADVPVRLHLSLGLYFDNSGQVQNYTGVSKFSRAVSEFAYGIAKDRVRTGLGAEWMASNVTAWLGLRPFIEYHWEVVTAEPDAVFNEYSPPLCKGSGSTGNGQPCRDNRDQQWVTLGLRAQATSGFTVGFAVDLSAHSVGVPYGPPLPPFNVVFGIAHAIDFATPKLVTRTVTVEKRVPVNAHASEGAVVGKVISAVGGAPVEGAIVSVPGRMKARVATDPDGTFRTSWIPAGLVELEVTAPNFERGSARTSVVPGQEVPLMVTLTPRAQKGKITGKVTDDKGKPVSSATVRVTGPQNAEVKTDEGGAFTAAVSGGAYVVHVEADHFLSHDTKIALNDGQEQDASVTVRPRPVVARVVVREGRLSVRQPIAFKGSAAEITPASEGVLDELADALATHPEVKKVRIEAHWDSSLPKDKAQELTTDQARAVASYLARQGVGEDRIEAVGMGAQRPLVPNIGAAKLRNRRVEFRVVN
jgi:outer membrane protein OmpA-like peptidoglycan-associated protein